jgi:hypothetical protein
MDIADNNMGMELVFAMFGFAGYRLADKRMRK